MVYGCMALYGIQPLYGCMAYTRRGTMCGRCMGPFLLFILDARDGRVYSEPHVLRR